NAARHVYANDTTPLAVKLAAASQVLLKQVNIFDLLGAVSLGLAGTVWGAFQAGWDRFLGLFGRRRPGRPVRGLYARYAQAARQATDLTPAQAQAGQRWEERLGQLAYTPPPPPHPRGEGQGRGGSHIHVLWPRDLADTHAVVREGLWHVCPAHVYEARVSPLGQVQVVVNYENCIKCETCWRTSDVVDWGRDGQH